jgi:GNAT superfamily N-acetyltransferase
MKLIRLTGDDWETLRELRLAALAGAPYAYGSTLAKEQALGEADWRRWFDKALWLVAVRNAEDAGTVSVFHSEQDTPMLVSVWVDPAHRGHAVGDALISEMMLWAAEKGWSRMVLRVAEGNDAARKLFVRHGFTSTGHYEPLESDPGVRTEILTRPL